MKQALIFSVILFCKLNANAQDIIYEEHFDNGIPDSFNVVDLDLLNPHDDDIFPSNDLAFVAVESPPGNFRVCGTSWYVPPGQADNWLITPSIFISSSDASMEWISNSRLLLHPETYQILVSTSGNEPADFTEPPIIEIDEEQWGGTGWAAHELSLADFAGQNIYIAFRQISNDVDILEIDDIVIKGEIDIVNGSSDIEDDPISVHVFPNPFSGNLNISLKNISEKQATVKLFDSTGKLVFDKGIFISNGEGQLTSELGNLPLGIYKLQIMDGNKTTYRKLVKI